MIAAPAIVHAVPAARGGHAIAPITHGISTAVMCTWHVKHGRRVARCWTLR